MKDFILKNIKELERFCTLNQISVEKVLKSPKSYNEKMMCIQHHNSGVGKNGLNDETPAKILLIIKKNTDGKIEFYPEPDFKQYLS